MAKAATARDRLLAASAPGRRLFIVSSCHTDLVKKSTMGVQEVTPRFRSDRVSIQASLHDEVAQRH